MSTQSPSRTPAEREKLHQEAERRWTRLSIERPDLAETIAFGRGLVNLYIDDLPGVARVAVTTDAAREKLARGLPLLEDEDIEFDLPGVRHFFFRLCSWASQQQELAPGGDRLQRAMMAGELRVDDLLSAALAGDNDAVAAVAEQFDVPLALVQTLTGFLVTGALMGAARVLAPLVAASGVAWDENFCPVCGGPPLLSELQGSAGERMLRCSACGIGWRYRRSRCAHCKDDEPAHLHYLSINGEEEKYRVDLCDRCRGYLKSVTSFAPTPPELLTIEDAAMLHLDQAARDINYTATPDLPE